MVPAVLHMAFELGAVGAADFAVSAELPITQAIVTFRRAKTAEVLLTKACPIVANVAQLRLTVPNTVTLGAGVHSYQLDVLSGGQPLRIAKGNATVAFGMQTTFL